LRNITTAKIDVILQITTQKNILSLIYPLLQYL